MAVSTVERVSPAQIKSRVQSGQALLVCAYPDQAQCDKMAIPGAIGLDELKSRMGTLPKDKEIILYCG